MDINIVVTILSVLASVWWLDRKIEQASVKVDDVRKELKSDIDKVADKADKANEFHLQIIDRLSKLEGKVDCIIENKGVSSE